MLSRFLIVTPSGGPFLLSLLSKDQLLRFSIYKYIMSSLIIIHAYNIILVFGLLLSDICYIYFNHIDPTFSHPCFIIV